MRIGLLAAFLGGALSLLSPCGALLLPAYFASSVASPLRRLANAGMYLLGLSAVLVPLGLGAGVIGSLLARHHDLLVTGASLVLIALGIATAGGLGLDLAEHVPGAGSLRTAASRTTGVLRTLLLGATGAVAGFCSGPILGAMLTLAAGQGEPLQAAVLMAVYALGMVVPLALLVMLWDRIGTRARRHLRGRTITLAGRPLHTTSLITGSLLIGTGVLFWVTSGLATLPALVPAGVLASAQEGIAGLPTRLVDAVAVLALGGLALLLWWRAHRRRTTSDAARCGGDARTGDAEWSGTKR